MLRQLFYLASPAEKHRMIPCKWTRARKWTTSSNQSMSWVLSCDESCVCWRNKKYSLSSIVPRALDQTLSSYSRRFSRCADVRFSLLWARFVFTLWLLDASLVLSVWRAWLLDASPSLLCHYSTLLVDSVFTLWLLDASLGAPTRASRWVGTLHI